MRYAKTGTWIAALVVGIWAPPAFAAPAGAAFPTKPVRLI